MSSELCRRPRAEMKLARNRQREVASIAELRFWEGKETILFESGEPMSSGRSYELNQDVEGHSQYVNGGAVEKFVVEKASRKDILARQEEQIERAKRMLDVGQKLTPQWRLYILNNAPELIFDKLLQRST